MPNQNFLYKMYIEEENLKTDKNAYLSFLSKKFSDPVAEVNAFQPGTI